MYVHDCVDLFKQKLEKRVTFDIGNEFYYIMTHNEILKSLQYLMFSISDKNLNEIGKDEFQTHKLHTTSQI